MAEIIVNGEVRGLPAGGQSVSGLLAEMGAIGERVAVMVSGAIVARAEHAGTELQEGDRVEVLTLARGG
jgi:thiamine biosynthesis protein ThiS